MNGTKDWNLEAALLFFSSSFLISIFHSNSGYAIVFVRQSL